MWLKQAHILERTLVVFRGILEELLEVEIILVLVDLIAIESIQVLVAIMMEETLLTSFKYALFLVMEQTGAKIDTILNLSLKGTLEEAILMVVSNLDKDNMARKDLFMALAEALDLILVTITCQRTQAFKGMWCIQIQNSLLLLHIILFLSIPLLSLL